MIKREEEIKYNKGIIFVKIGKILIKENIHKIEDKIIPIILLSKVNKIVFDLNNLILVDKSGINFIISISNIVSNNNGKVVIYNINDKIKNIINRSDIFDYCFHSSDKKGAIKILKT